MSRATMATGMATQNRAMLEMAMSIERLTTLLKPCSGTSLMLMTGRPSRSSRRARSAVTCRRSGTTVTSTLSRLVDRAEERQPAVSEVVAAGAVVDESDDLIPELAMIDDLVGDQASQFAG